MRLAAAAELPLAVDPATRDYLNVWASLDSGATGDVLIGPCGGSGRRILDLSPRGAVSMVVARPDDCFTSTANVTLSWQRIGTADFTGFNVPGYQSFGSPGVVFDRVVENGVAVVDVERVFSAPVYNFGLAKLTGAAFQIVTTGGSAGHATLRRCDDSASPHGPTVLVGSPQGHANVVYVQGEAGTGQLCLDVSGVVGSPRLTVIAVGAFVDRLRSAGTRPPTVEYGPGTAPRFRPNDPYRVLDTRWGIGGTSGLATPGTPLVIDLTGRLPTTTTSVALNITATGAQQPGYVTAYNCDQPKPETSNLNFGAGEDTANLVTVAVGPAARVCLVADVPTHLVADLAGSFGNDDSAAGYRRVPPRRMVDTRASGTPVGPEAPMQFRAETMSDVPPNVSALVFTLTATRSTAPGYLTVYPCAEAVPPVSNLNFSPGRDVANLVVMEPSDAGLLCVYASSTTDVLVDLAGYFVPGEGAGFVAVAPSRQLDSRQTTHSGGFQIDVDEWLTPAAMAVVANVTATDAQATGFATAISCENAGSDVSNLNYSAGHDQAALALIPIVDSGPICLQASSATDLLFDLFGYFTEEPVIGSRLVVPDIQ